jgi:calcium/calmodulin-dependent 3',5'-cyclic nucleotide phosphodiesterase
MTSFSAAMLPMPRASPRCCGFCSTKWLDWGHFANARLEETYQLERTLGLTLVATLRLQLLHSLLGLLSLFQLLDPEISTGFQLACSLCFFPVCWLFPFVEGYFARHLPSGAASMATAALLLLQAFLVVLPHDISDHYAPNESDYALDKLSDIGGSSLLLSRVLFFHLPSINGEAMLIACALSAALTVAQAVMFMPHTTEIHCLVWPVLSSLFVHVSVAGTAIAIARANRFIFLTQVRSSSTKSLDLPRVGWCWWLTAAACGTRSASPKGFGVSRRTIRVPVEHGNERTTCWRYCCVCPSQHHDDLDTDTEVMVGPAKSPSSSQEAVFESHAPAGVYFGFSRTVWHSSESTAPDSSNRAPEAGLILASPAMRVVDLLTPLAQHSNPAIAARAQAAVSALLSVDNDLHSMGIEPVQHMMETLEASDDTRKSSEVRASTGPDGKAIPDFPPGKSLRTYASSPALRLGELGEMRHWLSATVFPPSRGAEATPISQAPIRGLYRHESFLDDVSAAETRTMVLPKSLIAKPLKGLTKDFSTPGTFLPGLRPLPRAFASNCYALRVAGSVRGLRSAESFSHVVDVVQVGSGSKRMPALRSGALQTLGGKAPPASEQNDSDDEDDGEQPDDAVPIHDVREIFPPAASGSDSLLRSISRPAITPHIITDAMVCFPSGLKLPGPAFASMPHPIGAFPVTSTLPPHLISGHPSCKAHSRPSTRRYSTQPPMSLLARAAGASEESVTTQPSADWLDGFHKNSSFSLHTLSSSTSHAATASDPPDPSARRMALTLVSSLPASSIQTAVKLLRDATSWSFDIFALRDCTTNRPLIFLLAELMTRIDAFSQFHVNHDVFLRYFAAVEREYCFIPTRPNAYHNSTHAADVVQACSHFLSLEANKGKMSILDDIHAFSLIVAAAVHDFRHPGCSNAYLSSMGHPLALRYNDDSVLENFHVAEAFTLMRRPGMELLSGLGKDDFLLVRQQIIQYIRATDLAKGGNLISRFKTQVEQPEFGSHPMHKSVLCEMIIKCADVSHPARPLALHKVWSNLISTEFFIQGDEEARLSLPKSPLCDRAKSNLPKGQLGFISFVVRPALDLLSHWLESHKISASMASNEEYWASLTES